MTLTGQVVKRPIALGSKSEHEAVMLEVADGQQFVLRRLGGNAFRDPVLDDLVTKRITGQGDLRGSTFLMREWTELD